MFKLWCPYAHGQETDRAVSSTKFLRLQSDGGEPRSLDTAVVTYRSASTAGISVDLIGAVHIGEKAYYAELNKLFDEYEVLLYELVAPEGTVIPAGGKRVQQGFNPIAFLQDSAKNVLGLESQLELVDYTKPNFVRADLTPAQISSKMAERGDTPLTLAMSTMAELLRQQNLATIQDDAQAEATLESGLLSFSDFLGNPLKIKRMMAAQFASTGSLDQALGGPLNQLLIVDRNAAALKELQKQVAAGRKKIGIFYGAAHMSDFERHLTEELGLVMAQQRWLPAWDLQRARAGDVSEPVSMLLNLLKGLE